jgi:hypothetical protein
MGAVAVYERATKAGFANDAVFALASVGATALASGDGRRAEELERRALAASFGRALAVAAARSVADG